MSMVSVNHGDNLPLAPKKVSRNTLKIIMDYYCQLQLYGMNSEDSASYKQLHLFPFCIH